MTRLGYAASVLTLAAVPCAHISSAELDRGRNSAHQVTDTGDRAASIERGRKLFAVLACGNCHILADARKGVGGPPLDHDPNLTNALIVNRITNGQRGMPAFGDQLSDQEIADLAAYILHAAVR